jgi:hypothetical protein
MNSSDSPDDDAALLAVCIAEAISSVCASSLHTEIEAAKSLPGGLGHLGPLG